MIDTSASVRPSFLRPIVFTIFITGTGVRAAAPVSVWPPAACQLAMAAAAAACCRNCLRSIGNTSPATSLPSLRDGAGQGQHGHVIILAKGHCRRRGLLGVGSIAEENGKPLKAVKLAR